MGGADKTSTSVLTQVHKKTKTKTLNTTKKTLCYVHSFFHIYIYVYLTASRHNSVCKDVVSEWFRRLFDILSGEFLHPTNNRCSHTVVTGEVAHRTSIWAWRGSRHSSTMLLQQAVTPALTGQVGPAVDAPSHSAPAFICKDRPPCIQV